MTETPNLILPYIAASQAQKHVTHNEAVRLLDGMVQLSVLSRVIASPPASPADGARYIVASGATGDWAGWDLNVAFWVDGAWMRLIPRVGWIAYSIADVSFYWWNGSAWALLSTASGSIFSDAAFLLQDNGDASKQAQFDLAAIASGTTRVFTLPNGSTTLAGLSMAQTFSGAQTFSATSNTFGGGAGTGVQELASGATNAGNTKTVNIGTAGKSGSTTAIAIGSAIAGALGTLTINTPTIALGANVTSFSMSDSIFALTDDADATKKAQFQLSGLATATTRTLTVPDASGTLVLDAAAQTLTGKTLTAPVVSGGTINNAVIGATTPAAVTGTSLTATGVITAGVNALPAGTLALAFATRAVATVTPNATASFTTTVPPAGTRCTLIVTTSGATSFTMTFGAGFKTTGTLVTGTVAAKTFVLEFISDGTSVIEASRTIAM